MYKLYYLTSPNTSAYYIGITKNTLSQRFASHRWAAKNNQKSPIYDAMRKYGDFKIELQKEFVSMEECAAAEIEAIATAQKLGHKLLNLHKGGSLGFDVSSKDIEFVQQWKRKLSITRQGRKPALGMKHSEENIKKFSEVSRQYWDTQTTYPKDIVKLSLKKAKQEYGISKTHYYRLRRASNECS